MLGSTHGTLTSGLRARVVACGDQPRSAVHEAAGPAARAGDLDVGGRPLHAPVPDLDRFFHPSSVAVVGASDTVGRPNSCVTRQLADWAARAGARLHPVHPPVRASSACPALRTVRGRSAGTRRPRRAAGRRPPAGDRATRLGEGAVRGRLHRSSEDFARAGRFCVNVLGEEQGGLCRGFAVGGADKFAGAAYRAAPVTGAPLLDGVAAWIDCTVRAVHTGGDHLIVVGRVEALDADEERAPLLFHRGQFERLAGLDV
jgi:hypothetical protein